MNLRIKRTLAKITGHVIETESIQKEEKEMTELNIVLGIIFGWLLIGVVAGCIVYVKTKNDALASYAFEAATILYGAMIVISGVLFWF